MSSLHLHFQLLFKYIFFNMNCLHTKSKLIKAVKQSVTLINYVNEKDTELFSAI